MFRPVKRFKKRITFLIVAIVAVISAIFAVKTVRNEKPESSPSGNLEAVFVDVDQGDSFFMEAPNGKTFLVDGGEFDTYESHLLPFLESRDIDKIDTAVVTHYHSDHMGGIRELVSDGMVKNLVLPDYPDTDNSRSDLEKQAERTNTAVTYVSMGDRIDSGYEELIIDVLHPEKGGLDGNNFHNNSSLVLRVVYGKTSFLITGDIETRAEKALLKNDFDIECDVLKVAHHGSSSSSSDDFIEAANPTYAIISAGRGNSYGHPHNEVMDLLQDEDIMIYRTDKDGHITFEVGPEKIEDISFSK